MTNRKKTISNGHAPDHVTPDRAQFMLYTTRLIYLTSIVSIAAKERCGKRRNKKYAEADFAGRCTGSFTSMVLCNVWGFRE
jgi:hypothetical protein